MIGADRELESREHRLAAAAALADALLERISLAATLDAAVGEAIELLESSALPTALFDPQRPAPRLANAAWRALFAEHAARDALPDLDELARVGATRHIAELALAPNGRPMYLAATLRVARGQRRDVIVVCVDITDEVIGRELSVGPEALVWSGVDGDADYFGSRFAYAATGAGLRDAIHAGDLASYANAVGRATREGVELEARVWRADAYRWHRIRIARARDGSRWFAAATDIQEVRIHDELLTLERTARANADEANRQKDLFIARVSHELRTPLTTMVLWEAVLRDEASNAAQRDTALDAIRQSVLVQSRVVGDLLDISRAISGKLRIDLRPIEIEHVLRGALEALAPLVREKGLVLERRGAESGGYALVDAARLRQIFDNLLGNAVNATSRGGTITVTVRHDEASIAVSIADTGCGIAAEFLPQLFEPFRQFEDSVGGLGLGLTIAKQLVELHGGTLVASSPGPDLGATLTFAIPATIAPDQPARPMRRTTDLRRTSVLVIDDDPRTREALSLLLHRIGADVETADSARAGRVHIAQRSFEVLVCDIAMPDEDGYGFIRSVRAAGNRAAAIALTAYASEKDVDRALAAGFDRHLSKPIDFESLVANIDELAAARRSA